MDDDSGPYGLILTLILIVVLIAINAFFASAEMAVVSVNQNRLKRVLDSGDKRAEILKKLTSEPTRFLSTIQVAITLAGFLSSATAGSKLSVYVVRLFASMGIRMNETIAMILVTLILSYFNLILGSSFRKTCFEESGKLRCARARNPLRDGSLQSVCSCSLVRLICYSKSPAAINKPKKKK